MSEMNNERKMWAEVNGAINDGKNPNEKLTPEERKRRDAMKKEIEYALSLNPDMEICIPCSYED